MTPHNGAEEFTVHTTVQSQVSCDSSSMENLR